MRPNQQNNKQRSRGRSNNNNNSNQRRGGGGNPLSRNYESNGPDIKIRGNAAHIAEKYVQLARDATSVGDNVMAENYLQHAEHYFRIILAAQSQFQPRQDHASDSAQDDDGDETDTGVANGASETTPVAAEGGEAETNAADEQAERPRRQRRPRRERVEAEAEGAAEGAEPVKAEEAEAAPAAEAAAEEEAPKRVRRPRRKKADEEAEAAPELPAFLTAGREAAAE